MTSIKEYMIRQGLISPNMKGQNSRKIAPEKVARIKQAIAAGNTSVTSLGKEFHVSSPTIYNVMKGKYDNDVGCVNLETD